jgi:hypothetical protein
MHTRPMNRESLNRLQVHTQAFPVGPYRDVLIQLWRISEVRRYPYLVHSLDCCNCNGLDIKSSGFRTSGDMDRKNLSINIEPIADIIRNAAV